MPLLKKYAHQLPVAFTDDQHSFIETQADGGSLAQVVRDAVDLSRKVAAGEVVTLSAEEYDGLLADESFRRGLIQA